MSKKVILISSVVSKLPNIVTVSPDQFLSGSFKDVYVLFNRSDVCTREIIQIKKHCQDNGLNPLIDGSYMDIADCILPDWREVDNIGYDAAQDKVILDTVQFLEEAETQRKLYQIEDVVNKSAKVLKLITLANDVAASFGERRNAVNFAYNIMFK